MRGFTRVEECLLKKRVPGLHGLCMASVLFTLISHERWRIVSPTRRACLPPLARAVRVATNMPPAAGSKDAMEQAYELDFTTHSTNIIARLPRGQFERRRPQRRVDREAAHDGSRRVQGMRRRARGERPPTVVIWHEAGGVGHDIGFMYRPLLASLVAGFRSVPEDVRAAIGGRPRRRQPPDGDYWPRPESAPVPHPRRAESAGRLHAARSGQAPAARGTKPVAPG